MSHWVELSHLEWALMNESCDNSNWCDMSLSHTQTCTIPYFSHFCAKSTRVFHMVTLYKSATVWDKEIHRGCFIHNFLARGRNCSLVVTLMVCFRHSQPQCSHHRRDSTADNDDDDFLEDAWFLFNDHRVTESSFTSFSSVTQKFSKVTPDHWSLLVSIKPNIYTNQTKHLHKSS